MNASARPPLAVITVAYNSADVLPGFLDSLRDGLAGVESPKIVVADNASSDDSAEIAANHPIRPRVVRTGRNGGYSAGINAAVATVRPDRDVLILNPDIRLLPGSAVRLLEELSDRSVGAVAPKIFNEDGSVNRSVRREPSLATMWSDSLVGTNIASRIGLGELVSTPSLYRDGGTIDWATGAALLIAADVRARVGLWDESFFLYSEEVDYLKRIRDGGFKVLFAPGAQCVHIGGAYHQNSQLSALMTRNRIRYYRRNNGPVSTEIYRLGQLVGSAMRYPLGPGHRAAFKAALTTQPKSSELSIAKERFSRLADETSGT